jgi:hypothetical protein
MSGTIRPVSDISRVDMLPRVRVNFVGEQDRLAAVAGQAVTVWL